MSTTLAIAGIVIKDLYRRKDFYVLFVLTALITVVMGSVNLFHDDHIVRYLKEMCLLLIWICSLVIAITTTARQIPMERESRTIFPLLAKPVTRTQVILGKFLGCTADGIALAAGREAHASHSSGGRLLDFSLVLAVCVHKVPEGLALGALLLGAGFRPVKVVLRVAAVEATTLLGGVLGWYFLQQVSDAWLDAVVAHVEGGFLFLASHAVFGEIFKHHKALVLISFGIGFGTMGVLTLLLRLH